MAFWAPPKRVPHPVQFDATNPVHFGFVMSAAQIRAFLYGIAPVKDAAQVLTMIATIEPSVPHFEPSSGVRIETTDEEVRSAASSGPEDIGSRVDQVIANLPKPTDCAAQHIRIQLIEFEKDDDANFHIDFITASSNLRALNYDIEMADRHKVLSHTCFYMFFVKGRGEPKYGIIGHMGT